jgi:hypothetical protein
VRRSLLLEGKVSINKGEIKFRHPKAPKPLIYQCDELDDEGLLLRGTGLKGRKYTALYDLRWAHEIYISRQAGTELIPCHLRDEDSIHANRDWAEVVQYLEEVQLQRDRQGSPVLQSQINFEHNMQQRISKAKRQLTETRKRSHHLSKAAMLKGIATNRKIETEIIHGKEADKFRCREKDPTTKSSRPISQVARKGSKYSRGPQITNIAELRKKRMGQ